MEEGRKGRGESDSTNKIYIKSSVLLLVVFLVMVVVLVRATQIYTKEGAEWTRLSETMQTSYVDIEPQRGDIFSHDGKVLASSMPKYYLSLDFQAGGFKEAILRDSLPKMAAQLSRLLGDRSPKQYESHLLEGLRQRSRNYPISKVRVSHNLLQELKRVPFLNMKVNTSGLKTQELSQREKPFGSLASRTIGDVYADKEKGGLNGLELQFDSLLRGKSGKGLLTRVRSYRTIQNLEEPVHGLDITTTIDVKVQDIAERVLVDKLKALDAEMGLVVLMDVKSGEVRAISNMGRISTGRYGETKNHAVSDLMEPGSTFKVASMMVALEDGATTVNDSIDCEAGAWNIYGKVMKDHNHKHGGYGVLKVPAIMHNSSNIGIAKIIDGHYKNDPAKFVDGLARIGLTKGFDIPIPGAATPRIKHPSNQAHWSRLSLPWMSMGYETQIPPIYSLAFFNAIANEGKMITPLFVKRISDNGSTVKSFKSEVINSSICSSKTLRDIRKMLEGVVEVGTASAVKSDYIKIAGKTGTAQVSQAGGYNRSRHRVSFAGYFPAEKPQYSVIVVILNPNIGYASGGAMAGSVVKQIAEEVYAHNFRTPIKSLKPDSSAVLHPSMKGGALAEVKRVINEFDLKVSSSEEYSDTKWVKTTSTEKGVDIVPVQTAEGIVPSVVGMGLKDALFLLEQSGLRVSISGQGRVAQQSLPTGSKVVKGNTIHIRLI